MGYDDPYNRDPPGDGDGAPRPAGDQSQTQPARDDTPTLPSARYGPVTRWSGDAQPPLGAATPTPATPQRPPIWNLPEQRPAYGARRGGALIWPLSALALILLVALIVALIHLYPSASSGLGSTSPTATLQPTTRPAGSPTATITPMPSPTPSPSPSPTATALPAALLTVSPTNVSANCVHNTYPQVTIMNGGGQALMWSAAVAQPAGATVQLAPTSGSLAAGAAQMAQLQGIFLGGEFQIAFTSNGGDAVVNVTCGG